MEESRNSDTALLVKTTINALENKKGLNIVTINLGSIHNAVTDYFVIVHGTSVTQVEALADEVIKEVKEVFGYKPTHYEGYENAEWILLDYVDVVVHIFQTDTRNFYQLEDLWADAEVEYHETKI